MRAKTQLILAINKVRGLKNVTVYALLQHTQLGSNKRGSRKHRRPDKATSPTYFNT